MTKIARKDIPGYEGLYQVSEGGNVFRLTHTRQTGRVSSKGQPVEHYHVRGRLKGSLNAFGYRCVSLTNRDGIRKRWSIHRLVMLAFIGPPPEGTEVMHLDSKPGNNRLSNLRYGSHTCNMAFVPENGKERKKYKVVRQDITPERYGLTKEQVLEVSRLLETRMFQTKIAEKFGVSDHLVSRIKRGLVLSDITKRTKAQATRRG